VTDGNNTDINFRPTWPATRFRGPAPAIAVETATMASTPSEGSPTAVPDGQPNNTDGHSPPSDTARDDDDHVDTGRRGGVTVYSPSAPVSDKLNPRSCVTCRRRKVRCDKHMPCSNCKRAHIPCMFPAPGRAPRRPRPKDPNAVTKGHSTEREMELMRRLRKLEGIVEDLSGQVEVEATRHYSASDSPDTEVGQLRMPPWSNVSPDGFSYGADRHKVGDRLVARNTGSPTGLDPITNGKPRPQTAERATQQASRPGRLLINESVHQQWVLVQDK
jgi:hypothetical protein